MIAENTGIYYNEEKMPELREADLVGQAERFLRMLEEEVQSL